MNPPAGAGPVLAILLVGFALVSRAHATDFDLAITRTDLYPDHAGVNLYFGLGAAGGDFDGDGYADLAVGEPGDMIVYVLPGSPDGLDQAGFRSIEPHPLEPQPGAGFFGVPLAALDADADGYVDLAVAATNSATVWLYRGSPSGLIEASQVMLTPVDAPTKGYSTLYGQQLRNAGDTNGDGFQELLVGDGVWQDEPNFSAGAVFLYAGTEAGVDPCAETRLEIPDRPASGYTDFGAITGGNGDLNGDGYADVVSECPYCGEIDPNDGLWTGKLFVWYGGTGGAGNTEPEFIPVCCALAMVPDLDGDGFDEVASIANEGNAVIFYGSASGPDELHGQRLSDHAPRVTGVGDADGDGLGDLLIGRPYLEDSNSIDLIFGAIDRPDYPAGLRLDHDPDLMDGWGAGLFKLGDINGDGQQDFAASAIYTGMYEGSLSVYSPVCTWYADVDGDGFGDPFVASETCQEPGSGWVAAADDCDDSDPAVHGSRWFRDEDGDGYGVAEGGGLACAAPSGTAASWQDCDDADPSRYPGAEDATEDGADQDCDGHDGLWPSDTGSCTDDSGDTGETAETGDTGIDSAAPLDSADSGGDAADTGDAAPAANPAEPGCGCENSSGAPGNTFTLLGFVGWAALVARQRIQATGRWRQPE